MRCIGSRRPLCSPRPDAGWMFISAGRSRTSPRRFIPLALPFSRRCGRCCAASPAGQTTTYGALARQLAAERGLSRMSAQAVGGAVGHNVISIIIPCHRVVGTNGSLTGYAGGIDKKAALLRLEMKMTL